MKKVTQMFFRTVCLLLSVLIIIGTAPTANAADQHPFIDVKEGSWYESSVVYVYENGLMNGTADDLFAPDLTMSRAMLVTVLYRYAQYPSARAHPFTDVKGGSWYASAVTWAYENGIINGTSPMTFSPDDDVTREQMVAIFYRFAAYLCYETVSDANLTVYADSEQISRYAQEPFKWAVSTGIVEGIGNDMLSPKGTATRAQCAAVIERFIRWTENDAVIDLTALEQYGRDYAYKTYGYDGNPNCNPDTGASYYPGYKVSFTTAEEAKGYIREKIDNQHRSDTYYEHPITMNKDDGSIARCKLNIYIEVVTESFGQPTEDVYIIWCYVGGHAEPYHQDYWMHVHQYATEIIEATCGHGGGALYTCSCGDCYIADSVPVLEHEFFEWEVILEPSYGLHNFSEWVEIPGRKVRRCTKCTYSVEDEITLAQWEAGDSNLSDYEVDNISLEMHRQNVDPRIEITVDGNYYRSDWYDYKHLSVFDMRGWGDPPAISINEEDCMEITYFKADGMKVSITLCPVEGYVARCVLREDGSYGTDVIGDFKD